MFRRSSSRELFFLGKETNPKENAKVLLLVFFINMKIVTNFEVVKLGYHIVNHYL